MDKPAIMIGLGEVLWDLLPSGKALGGAPANFAYMAKVLGHQGIVASRVGNDELGQEAKAVMQGLGLNTSYLQEDDQHQTGTAGVLIDSGGQPTFTIKESVSWDFLDWTSAWQELAARADVVCFGTLAQRAPTSAATIDGFLRTVPHNTLRICDVNLRQSFYNRDVLHRSLRHADIVKLNDQEFLEVSSLLTLGVGSEETLARRLLDYCSLRLVCITRGARGSLLVSEDKTVEHGGFSVKVADAIGAGDAFTACLAHYYLSGETLEDISRSANRFASWVATQIGATPLIHEPRLHDILNGIVLD